MGQVYQIPRVNFDLNVPAFNNEGNRYPLTNEQQILITRMTNEGIISGYRTRNYITNRTTSGYLACDSEDCFLAYWRISSNSCGFYYRVDAQCLVGTAYDRPPDTYDGYFSEVTQPGLTRHTEQGTENEILDWVLEPYDTEAEALNAIEGAISDYYPITYHYTNSTVSGPAEAMIDDTVTVSAVPDAGYGITDAASQILVTNDNVAVPYTWDAQNNRITFTMPQPATNRGGFGSTGQ